MYPGCIFHEVSAAVSMLSDFCQIETAAPTREPIKDSKGLVFVPNHSVGNLVFEDFACALVPGGDFESVKDNKELDVLLRKFYSAKRVVAAICNGSVLLAKAGLLAGNRCTHTCVEKYAPLPNFQPLLDFTTPLFEGSHYVDENVVVDKNVVTAKPWAAIEYAAKVTQMCCDIDDQLASRLLRYYKGTPH